MSLQGGGGGGDDDDSGEKKFCENGHDQGGSIVTKRSRRIDRDKTINRDETINRDKTIDCDGSIAMDQSRWINRDESATAVELVRRRWSSCNGGGARAMAVELVRCSLS